MPLDLAPYLEAIENDLQQLVRADSTTYAGLYDMLRYHLGWQDAGGEPIIGRRGKRLRPLLCLLASEAVGGEWRTALPAASSLEMIHNFTLIHDDIEDDSPIRHQRPTVWSVWGLAQGLNAGDALWALARGSVYRLTAFGHAPATALAVAKLLDETCLALCHGQYLDIASEGDRTMTEDTYRSLIRGKTAALCAASVKSGAVLGHASPSLLGQMEQFGLEMGLAFQMADDLLGIWGDPTVTGKSAASDLATHKMTLPVIHALAWEDARGEDTLFKLLGRKASEENVPAILAALNRSGAREAVEKRAAEAQGRMLAIWESMQLSGPAAEALYQLALGVADRQY